MTKILKIEGMMCHHCTGRVEQALAALPGVEAVEISLEDKTATLTLQQPVENQILTSAVTQAGYEVVEIQ